MLGRASWMRTPEIVADAAYAIFIRDARRGIVNNLVGFTVYGDYAQPNPPAP